MTPNANALPAPELELMDRLAGYLKYASIYPANNNRVKRACDEFFGAFERVKVKHGARVVVALHGERFVVANVTITEESPVIEWARESFKKTLLGGVEIDANVQRWSLAKFADRMRENLTFPDNTFDGFWEQDFPGIRPFELRYSSVADTPHEVDRVVESLMEDDQLMERLEALGEELKKNMPQGEAAQINLLEPIRKALPVEAVLDPKQALELVERILEICESKVKAMVAQEEFSDQELMEVALAGIGRRYFKAHVKDMQAPPQDSLPEGRPEDENTQDNLEEMLAEFAMLPSDPDIRLEIEGRTYEREQLGVYLHQLVASDSNDGPVVPMIQRALRKHPEHYDLLEPYVDRCLGRAGLEDENRGLWRIIELLQKSDPQGLLRDRKVLTAKAVEVTFPRQLVPFLDSIRGEQSRELAQLADICRRVGPDRIEAAADYLLGEAELITRRRLQKLLSVDSAHLLPLVGVIARVSNNWVREEVAKFIRRRNPPYEESGALRVVRPTASLSPLYLQGLCVRRASHQHKQWLREESARLIRVFLRDTAGHAELTESRLRAVHMLATMPSEDNYEMIAEVARESRFGMGAARSLRAAARAACKKMRAELARRGDR